LKKKCTAVLKMLFTAIAVPLIFTACNAADSLLDEIMPVVNEVFPPEQRESSSSSSSAEPEKNNGSQGDKKDDKNSSQQSSKQSGGLLDNLLKIAGGKQASSSSASTAAPKTTADTLLGNYNAAVKKNADTVAWLNIPQTTVNAAVMQSFDNNYYLRRNDKRESSEFGCYFADFESSLESVKTIGKNTVIYGHSDLKDNQNGQKFSQLFKFLNEDFAKNTPYIYLALADGVSNWEVFGVIYTDTKFDYIRSGFKNDDDFNAFIAEARSRSIYNYTANVTAKDKILTLSTCTKKYGNSDNQRFLIMAKQVEKAEKKTAVFSKNPSPKLPQI